MSKMNNMSKNNMIITNKMSKMYKKNTTKMILMNNIDYLNFNWSFQL
jgi:hypothetical protein